MQSAIRRDKTCVRRLELSSERKPSDLLSNDVQVGFRQVEPRDDVLVARMFHHGQGRPVLSLEATPKDRGSMDRLQNFIQSTEFESLFLNISNFGAHAEESFGSLIVLALLQPKLKAVELPAEFDVPSEIVDLLVQYQHSDASWSELALVNLVVQQAQDDVTKKFMLGEVPPAHALRKIESHIPSLSLELAETTCRILGCCRNITKLSIVNSRIPRDTRFEHRRDDAARRLAMGIRTSTNLKSIVFDGTRMTMEAQLVIADSIVSNASIRKCNIVGYDCGNSLGYMLERLSRNDRIKFGAIESSQDFRMVEVLATLLQKKRRVRNLSVGLTRSGIDRSSRFLTDALGHSLAAHGNKRFGSIDLFGHMNFSREQWARLWKLFQRAECDALRLCPYEMPVGWEHDFVAALPKLLTKNLSFYGRVQFDTTVVGYDLVLAALKKNYNLEGFLLGANDMKESERPHDHHIVCYLNWAGRRIEVMEPNSFHLALWPSVLERVNKVAFKSRVNVAAASTFSKVDVLFYFLKGPLLEVFRNDRDLTYNVYQQKEKKRKRTNAIP